MKWGNVANVYAVKKYILVLKAWHRIFYSSFIVLITLSECKKILYSVNKLHNCYHNCFVCLFFTLFLSYSVNSVFSCCCLIFRWSLSWILPLVFVYFHLVVFFFKCPPGIQLLYLGAYSEESNLRQLYFRQIIVRYSWEKLWVALLYSCIVLHLCECGC
jgi:hypothetical protein